MTYRGARQKAAGMLREAGIENETAESGFLMEAACGADLSFFLLHQMEEMPEADQQAFFELTKKRCRRIPLQHLTGTQEFMGLAFRVNEHVLIPRQDTELLAEEALKEIADRKRQGALPVRRILDMCTGSGCIAVSLKHFCPEAEITGCDVSVEALKIAKENAADHHAEVSLVQSDLFSCIGGNYDMIVSNPPYIPSGVIRDLMPEVRDHEPRLALDGSTDGLLFYKKIIKESVSHLEPGGMLLFEIGYDQGKQVSDLMREHGFTDIEIIPDLAGLDRVVKGRRSSDV